MRKSVAKVLFAVIILTLALSMIACKGGGNQSETPEEVCITSVNGAEISGTEITMVVSDSTDEVDLTNKVVLNSDNATWKLYYDKLGQMEIPTKLATTQSGGLRPGSNLFYIVVTSADGTQSKTYTLDVYKKVRGIRKRNRRKLGSAAV